MSEVLACVGWEVWQSIKSSWGATSRRSVGQRGSFDQLEECKEFLRNYVSTDCAITFDNKGIDFESIGEMTRRLKSVLKKYKGQGLGYDDVMIDVTGGMKTTSIAAATEMTL